MVLHDMLPFVLACVDIPMDCRWNYIWHQNNFTSLFFLNMLPIFV